MCGRYYVDGRTARIIEKLVGQTDTKISMDQRGDIYPSQTSFVLTGKMPALSAEEMFWGFQIHHKKGLLINARAETVKEKAIFRSGVLYRRCIVPAGGFYEWDATRNKVTFSREDGSPLYMAGFYQKFENRDCFVILTTQANESVRRVHDRMPLILEEKELEDWVYDEAFLDVALRKSPVQLQRHQEYEQQSLF